METNEQPYLGNVAAQVEEQLRQDYALPPKVPEWDNESETPREAERRESVRFSEHARVTVTHNGVAAGGGFSIWVHRCDSDWPPTGRHSDGERRAFVLRLALAEIETALPVLRAMVAALPEEASHA